MPIIDVLGASKQDRVMKETWGHLAPIPRTIYAGFIVFSVSPNGDHNLLDFDFEGLDGNPWTMEHVSDWWSDETEAPQFAAGTSVAIWRWEGTYMVQKNEVPKFRGQYIRMRLLPPAAALVGKEAE